jgi:pyruvate-ferredoxin/flavodoxin oxidoreductase
MKGPKANAETDARLAGWPAVLDGRAAVDTVETLVARTGGGQSTASLADSWAAAVTAGMSMAGMRTALTNRRQLTALHESLYADAGKRLTYVLNVASRSATKHGPSANPGHDDYHAIDDAGLFQLFAHDVQSAADYAVIAHRIAELSLTPGLVAHDTGHAIQSLKLAGAELLEEYLGNPADLIDAPTPAQRLVYGERRRRVPELFDLDYPAMLGAAQSPESYGQGVAAQRPFYFDHVAELADRAFAEYAALTGRSYARVGGHWLDDAEYLVVAQGSIVPIAEAVCDHLRATRWIRLGVLNLSMFRPFPADVLSKQLAGRKGVTVLERVDQPLSADPPLMAEIRATMLKAVENGRARQAVPFPGIAVCKAPDVPPLYAGCYGLGGRAIHGSDIMAVVTNMVGRGAGRRYFYLGIDFIRPGTRLPKQQVWQDQLLDSYPHVAELTLAPGPPLSLLSAETVAARVLGLEASESMMATSRTLAALADVLGLTIQACPRVINSPAGSHASLDASFMSGPVRVGAVLDHVTAAVAYGPQAFGAAGSLEEIVENGTLVVERHGSLEDTWCSLPASVRRTVVGRRLRTYALDVSELSKAASAEADRHRLRAAAFVGALCRVSRLVERAKWSQNELVERLGPRLATEYPGVNADACMQAFMQGFETLCELTPEEYATVSEEPVGTLPVMPAVLGGTNVAPGLAHGGRFWEQVGVLNTLGQEVLADPYAALGAIPAATSAMRDMTPTRDTVPALVAERCTGCGACWVQCPEAAIPGVVSDVADLLSAAITTVEADRRCDRMRQILKPLSGEIRRLVKTGPFASFADLVSTAFATVSDKLGFDADRRDALDQEFAAVRTALADFPVARTDRFFTAHESQAKGTGGLLSVTVNPAACKGCDICVEACEEDALVSVPQTNVELERLRRNWSVWQHLPETDDRYLEDGDEAVTSLLLKQSVYQSMTGGDDLAPGAGDKTALHLVLSAVTAFAQPRARRHVDHLTELIDGLDHKARELLASDAKVDDARALDATSDGKLYIPIGHAKHEHLERISEMLRELTDLRWRYTEGPGGKGRAACGMTNDGSAAWGSTYPYNPYPFPWASHLLHDAPSVATGVFEGHMRKMARGFAAVRRAELELAGEYDPEEHESALRTLDWRQFTDEELGLCPPMLAVGGTPTMLDLGFQNLSRLLATDRPLRVVVFDTPASTDPAGPATRRRDLSLLAIAHRHAYVLQSSLATPSHLLSGVTRGLSARGPALFVLHSPPARRSGSDARDAKLALESRVFPALVYDPEAGTSLGEQLSLDGNPAIDQTWPAYELAYTDDERTRKMTLPVTVADWAAAQPDLGQHFTRPTDGDASDSLMRFDEYLATSPAERDGRTPFIFVLEEGGRLGRRVVADPIVVLATERLGAWRHLRQLAGHDLPPSVRARVTAPVEAEFERRVKDLESQHRAQMADVQSRYPVLIARRLVEGLVRAAGDGTITVAELLKRAQSTPGITPLGSAADGNGRAGEVAEPPAGIVMPPAAESPKAAEAAPAESVAAPAAAPEAEEADEGLTMDPYIQSELCTSCDECININKRMFAYNKQKQAYIKDSKAGTFRQLVMAAQKCPVSIIHPGTPLNPDEPDLEKWVQQAARFQ